MNSYTLLGICDISGRKGNEIDAFGDADSRKSEHYL